MKTTELLLTVLMVVSVTTGQVASGGDFTLEKSSIAGGGLTASGGDYVIGSTAGQAAAGKFKTGNPFIVISGFWVPDTLAPTAGEVTISGRVRHSNGAGIGNVEITLYAPSGKFRTVRSSSKGMYQFEGLDAGQTYVLTVWAKKYIFVQPTIVITTHDSVSDADFVVVPNSQE